MRWIDAHCHLSDPRLPGGPDAAIADCIKAGITRFVLGGVDPADWNRQLELAALYPGAIIPSFGLHPWWVHDRAAEGDSVGGKTLDSALALLEFRLPECKALGEAGLDNARDRFKASKDLQFQAFEAQLQLARKHAKPLVLHVVQAHSWAQELIAKAPPAAGGIVHSFSGSWADARKYLDLGLHLSISARVTYPEAHALHETVLKTPGDRIVFETDAPDQPPHGTTDRLHTPLSLLKVVQQASEIRQESPDRLLNRSRVILEKLFQL